MRRQKMNQTTVLRRNSFSLRMLFIVVAGFAILFACLSYFRSTRAIVEYTFLEVESANLALLASNMKNVAGSPYEWTHLNESETQALLRTYASESAGVLHKRSSIHHWPLQAETSTGTRAVFLEVSDPRQGEHPAKLPMFETARLNGFLGVRLAGGRLQLRVDAEVGYERPDDGVEPKDMSHPVDKVQGKLFYEGQAPRHALIFAAPLDEHTHQVVMFAVNGQRDGYGGGATEQVDP